MKASKWAEKTADFTGTMGRGSPLLDNRVMNSGLICRTIANLTLAIVCVGCSPSVSHDEVARSTSPDGRLDAMLFEENGGATTSFGYELELGSTGSRRGEKAARLHGAVRNAQSYGANLHWENNSILVIERLKTKTPADVPNSVEVDGRTVQIVLNTGVEDKSAPSGGMLSTYIGVKDP